MSTPDALMQEIRAAAEQPATRKCQQQHSIVGANAYHVPSTGRLDCQLCRLARLARSRRDRRPRPSTRIARLPLSPELVQELRRAAGLAPPSPRTPTD